MLSLILITVCTYTISFTSALTRKQAKELVKKCRLSSTGTNVKDGWEFEGCPHPRTSKYLKCYWIKEFSCSVKDPEDPNKIKMITEQVRARANVHFKASTGKRQSSRDFVKYLAPGAFEDDKRRSNGRKIVNAVWRAKPNKAKMQEAVNKFNKGARVKLHAAMFSDYGDYEDGFYGDFEDGFYDDLDDSDMDEYEEYDEYNDYDESEQSIPAYEETFAVIIMVGLCCLCAGICGIIGGGVGYTFAKYVSKEKNDVNNMIYDAVSVNEQA